MKKKVYKVSAPGKIILSGEHAVVYGHPAIVTAVDKRLAIKQEGSRYEIVSDIPIGCGMGSSAALAVASSALDLMVKRDKWNLDKINEKAYQMEKKHHGNPSGGDNTVSTYGGFLWYRKEAEGFKLFSQLVPRVKIPRFILINTGKPKETTKEMVALVAGLCRKRRKKTEKLLQEIEGVTKSFLAYLLRDKRYRLPDLILHNERWLELLGVVSESTRRLIRQIEGTGGVAKITGAGGVRGNSGLLLAYHENPEKLITFAKKMELEYFNVKLGEEGVKNEKN